MTDVKQHQMPQRHVIDNAEKAIQVAKDAEMAVRHAQLESNPHKLAAALAELEAAQHALGKADSQLEARDQGHLAQELVQVRDQLTQAQQSLDVTASNTQQPRQMR
ncbi:hypothetical protein SAMN02799630_05279 [Paenibacillus sp. UNCCL117]|uniref:hypothetical protein n=1 Tax=unclassified Paenibacillus TaxID=185978 RepID=UPI00087F2515|nr:MULTISPECIES: hypothetical protein [unclassified Paenibacillus]SDE37149.1 hypothetical protein SAMN04488602_12624 [Paenibacillus sp. cl123]SFW64895.1 hypothetical protein SAMN02799630_05279 [Paenibacillus sp. UNCCL117]